MKYIRKIIVVISMLLCCNNIYSTSSVDSLSKGNNIVDSISNEIFKKFDSIYNYEILKKFEDILPSDISKRFDAVYPIDIFKRFDAVYPIDIFKAYFEVESEINFSRSNYLWISNKAKRLKFQDGAGYYKAKRLPLRAYSNNTITLNNDSTFTYYATHFSKAKGAWGLKGSVLLLPSSYTAFEHVYYVSHTFIVLKDNILLSRDFQSLYCMYEPNSHNHSKHIDRNLGLYNPNVYAGLKMIAITEYHELNNIVDNVKIADSAYIYCYNIQTGILPNQIESIGKFSFSNCINLKNIHFSNNVYMINDFAFSNCWSLDSVMLPNSIKEIGAYSFLNCAKLNTISLPDSINTISKGLFQQCSNLQYIKIPSKIDVIENFAFLVCPNLKTVISENTVPPRINKFSFDIKNNITVYVPTNSLDAYKNHELWGKLKIKPMSELPKKYTVKKE